MPALPTLVLRTRAHLAQRRRSARLAARLKVDARTDLRQFGDLNGGGYVLPTSLLDAGSVCYLAGAGEDISFDLAVIARFGCRVHTLDPVPRAEQHVAAAAAHQPRLTFHPVALWSSDETLTFHAPPEADHVSQSAVNLNRTAPDFRAPARSIPSLMAELGHDHLDLLKISIAGAEYEVLDHLIANNVDVRVLCVEYSPPAPVATASRSVQAIERAGYVLASASVLTWSWKLTFVGPQADHSQRIAHSHRAEPARRRTGVLRTIGRRSGTYTR